MSGERENLDRLKKLIESGGGPIQEHVHVFLGKAILELDAQVRLLTTMYREMNPIITNEMIDQMEKDFT